QRSRQTIFQKADDGRRRSARLVLATARLLRDEIDELIHGRASIVVRGGGMRESRQRDVRSNSRTSAAESRPSPTLPLGATSVASLRGPEARFYTARRWSE